MRQTAHYKLPIFETSDQPKWLVDWNSAMQKIDIAIHTAATGDPDAPDISELYGMVQVLQSQVDLIISNLYSEYDDTRAYEKNDFCTHEGELYICTEETFVGDPFSNLNWQTVQLTSVISDMLDRIGSVADALGYTFNEDTNYNKNDLVWHDNILYKFTSNYTAGDGWDVASVITVPTVMGAEVADLLTRVAALEGGGTPSDPGPQSGISYSASSMLYSYCDSILRNIPGSFTVNFVEQVSASNGVGRLYLHLNAAYDSQQGDIVDDPVTKTMAQLSSDAGFQSLLNNASDDDLFVIIPTFYYNNTRTNLTMTDKFMTPKSGGMRCPCILTKDTSGYSVSNMQGVKDGYTDYEGYGEPYGSKGLCTLGKTNFSNAKLDSVKFTSEYSTNLSLDCSNSIKFYFEEVQQWNAHDPADIGKLVANGLFDKSASIKFNSTSMLINIVVPTVAIPDTASPNTAANFYSAPDGFTAIGSDGSGYRVTPLTVKFTVGKIKSQYRDRFIKNLYPAQI